MSETPRICRLAIRELGEEQRKGRVLLNTRPAEQFASFHIRGSIQISLMGRFAGWAAILIDLGQTLVLIAEDERSAQEAHNRLARVGLVKVIGYTVADEREWRERGIQLANISVERCAEVSASLKRVETLQLVDVRSRAEWLQGHLLRAISLPLLDLQSKVHSIDLSKQSLVYCHEGYRATTAVSILLQEADGNIGILIDGIEGWAACGCRWKCRIGP